MDALDRSVPFCNARSPCLYSLRGSHFVLYPFLSEFAPPSRAAAPAPRSRLDAQFLSLRQGICAIFCYKTVFGAHDAAITL